MTVRLALVFLAGVVAGVAAGYSGYVSGTGTGGDRDGEYDYTWHQVRLHGRRFELHVEDA